MKLTGYQILEQIYAGSRTLVYRGIREQDQQPVVIKLMRSEYPSFSEIIQFRNQYTIAKNLNLPGIIRPYSLENYHNGYALVMEDFGGVSLKDYATNLETSHITSLQQFLQIAIQIVSTLDGLYLCRVIHKDIKPANILINPTTNEVRLIDFSIASLLPRETQTLTSPNVLEGTLAYLSPEQTGRMNRGIDYRTDFYSLGVTFFELLTGQLPFQSDDLMELIHCHIAKLPPGAYSLNPDIPPILSEITSKLMAKNPQDRYQSALGLKHDLEVCLHQWQRSQNIASFQLGVRDISDRFIIPEKLYGREVEITALLQAFDRVSTGKADDNQSKIEMMLVVGFSGIGKTAVVNEVHKPIVRARGYFIKGKYDQFQRNIPLNAFVQAFRDLMGQLLRESDAQLKQWTSKILSALGAQARVIIDVIPELERIIGVQPPVSELFGSAATNRFNLLFQRFIHVFCTKKHPLVMFLDDLQWADSASLKLMQLLMSETDTHHLLLIGAYRDSEVSTAHPLMLTLEEIRKGEATVNTITLTPLKKSDLNHLVADTLSCPIELAQPLAELVFQKTQGNPFFATQFLKALYEDGLITFDPPQSPFSKSEGGWQCDITQVKALALTNDVVEFMALQLQKLPQETQFVLKLAACIGNQFDLSTLSIVYEKSQVETATDLWKALQEGLIIPISEVYKFYQNDGNSSLLTVNCQLSANYRFLHDRVQQASYSLIPEDRKQSTHQKIGQLLLTNTQLAEQEEKIFEIVNQLNYGVELIPNTQRDELAQLNLRAGRKAKASTAYAAAVEYLSVGIGLLAVDCWQKNYNLTLALHEEAVEATYLNSDFERMEQIALVVIQQAKTILDTVPVYAVRIPAYQGQGRMLEALKMGLQILKSLEVSFPEQPSYYDISQRLAKTTSNFHNKSLEELIHLPEMTEPTKLAAQRLIGTLIPSCYRTSPELFPLMVCEQIELSINRGNSPWSAYGYVSYSMVMSGSGDIESSYRSGELALHLLEKFRDKKFKAPVFNTVYAYTMPWKKPLRESLKPLQEAYQSGLETGDLEFASYSAFNYCALAYCAGWELADLKTEMATYAHAISRINQATMNFHRIFHQVVLNLLGESQSPYLLIGEAFDEVSMLPRYLETNDIFSLCLFYINKMTLCYLYREYDRAVENGAAAAKCLEGIAGAIFLAVFNFYESLSQLAIYLDSQEERLAIQTRVAANQEKMQKWADCAPMNYLHKYYLVEAERYRVQGKYVEAMDYYDRAIAKAKENKYIQEEALAHELAAKFYLEWGKEVIAQTYLLNAYYAYVRWGALAKAEDLEKRYPQLLTCIIQREKTLLNPTETISGSTSNGNLISYSSSSISNVLDLTSVIKASQTLSREIELDKLLSMLMHMVIENAGASKGSLVLLRRGKLVIKAISLLEKTEIFTVVQSVPIEDSTEIPITLINYVSRTLETLVIDDATTDDSRAFDLYIMRQQPKSLLCTPLLSQGKLIGVLTLENNLAIGAFTRDRLTIVQLLCSQAAISLENAHLYQQSQEYAQQLEQSLENLKQMQLHLVQSEKMSALGNLVAGVAHEINNPVGFIAGNIQPAADYVNDLFGLIDLYQQKFPHPGTEIVEEIEAIDLEYVREDLPKLITSMNEGVSRIRHISTSLRTFSRADSDRKVSFNIHEGIDSTIMILKHRLKASDSRPEIKVVRNYSDLPLVECFAGQLNQVFMNLLANAIDALLEGMRNRDLGIPTIWIHTDLNSDNTCVVIRIQDNGIGMSAEVQQKVFDHLFTTKSVGQGTGLGLSIARQIVEEKHGGTLTCHSEIGKGTEFAIVIPIC